MVLSVEDKRYPRNVPFYYISFLLPLRFTSDITVNLVSHRLSSEDPISVPFVIFVSAVSVI